MVYLILRPYWRNRKLDMYLILCPRLGENIYTKCTRILVHGQGTCSQPHFMTSVVSRTSGVRHNSNYLISFQVVTCNLFPVTLHTLCGWRTMSECTLSNLCDRHSSIILWQFWFYGRQLAGRIFTLQIRPYIVPCSNSTQVWKNVFKKNSEIRDGKKRSKQVADVKCSPILYP